MTTFSLHAQLLDPELRRRRHARRWSRPAVESVA